MNQVQADFHAAFVARRARMAARAVLDRPISLVRPAVVKPALVLPMAKTKVKAEPAAKPGPQATAHVNAYTRYIFGVRRGAPPISLIIAATARAFEVEPSLLMSKIRTAHAVHPRQMAMFLAKEITGRSLPDIGRRFGGRDHTTVLHAFRKVERQLGEPMVVERIAAIKADIAANWMVLS